MNNFPYTFWGITRDKLNSLDKVCNQLETKYNFTEDNCNDIDCESRELAEKYIKIAKYPFSDLTDIICKATLETILSKICETQNLNPDDFDIDITSYKPRLIYKGKEV